MKKLFLFLMILFLSIQAKAFAYNSDNYINELDNIKPFFKMPVSVWVQNSVYSGSVFNAFNEWHRASGGCVKFVNSKNESTAQIRVYFVNSLPADNGQHLAGLTQSYMIKNKYTGFAKISIAVYPPKSNKPFSQNQVFAIAVHEIGHALGLQGHSSNRNDIMFPNTNIIGIYASRRDYNTIRRVYCK